MQTKASHPKTAGHQERPREVQRLWQYHRRVWHQLYRYSIVFFVLIQALEPGNQSSFALGRVQSFPLKESLVTGGLS